MVIDSKGNVFEDRRKKENKEKQADEKQVIKERRNPNNQYKP